MRIKRLTYTALAIACTCSAMVAANAATGEETAAWQSPFHYDTAERVAALDNDALPAITADEAAVIDRMVADVPRSTKHDLGPTSDDLPPASTGRVLLDAPGVARIAGVASERGDVCLVHSFGGDQIDGVCIQTVRDEGGAAYVSGYAGSARHVYGVYAPGVTSIAVVTEDGQVTDATLTGNVFAWRGDSTPTELVTTRDGKVHRTAL